jgi:hypothetical protein
MKMLLSTYTVAVGLLAVGLFHVCSLMGHFLLVVAR